MPPPKPVLGFTFGMTRSELEQKAEDNFRLTPGTHATLLEGQGKVGSSELAMTWTFDEGSRLVEISARPVEAPSSDTRLEETALFAELKQTLGAPDKTRREHHQETASGRRGDAVVVIGSIVSVSKGSGRKQMTLSMDAWSDRHRKAGEAKIKIAGSGYREEATRRAVSRPAALGFG